MTRHGKVIDIIALRKDGLRGQAFVIFDDVQAATAALQSEQGFTFFGKDLKLDYAREKSDRVAKWDGTYVPKAKRQKLEIQKRYTPAAAVSTTITATENIAAKNGADATPPTAPQVTQPNEQPTHILFADKLPLECNEMMLAMLFRQYAGFKEVRIPRPGLAFIEFENEPHATLALDRLNGFKLTTSDQLKLAYGKT